MSARPGRARRPDRAAAARLGAGIAVVGAVLTAVAAVVVVPWDWLPGGAEPVRVAADQVFSRAELARLDAFADLQRLIGLASYAVSLAVSAWLGLTRSGSRLLDRLPRRWWLRVALGVLAVLLVGRVATLPFAVAGRLRALDVGLSTRTWPGWLLDQVLALAVSWVSIGIALLVLVGLARRRPRTWPAWAAVVSAALVVLGSYVWPVVVEPLFDHFRDLPRGPLRTSVVDLARREGVPVDRVLLAEASRRTTAANAYVSGFGGTRRVVLYDTLVRGFRPAEVEAVLGHELAHAKYDDPLVGTALAALGTASGVGALAWLLGRPGLRRRAGVDGAGDPRVVPLVLALAAGGALLAGPVENTVSRAMEARADRVSLELTGNTRAFVRMQRRLDLTGYGDPDPPALYQLWFGSHPTTLERVGIARALESTR